MTHDLCCPECGNENDITLVLIADFIEDPEGRPYAAYVYRCGSCGMEFEVEYKSWEQ